MHGEQPGDAHVEALLRTRHQGRLCTFQNLLRFLERRLGVGIQFDVDVVGLTRLCPQRTDSHLVARHLFSVRRP